MQIQHKQLQFHKCTFPINIYSHTFHPQVMVMVTEKQISDSCSCCNWGFSSTSGYGFCFVI